MGMGIITRTGSSILFSSLISRYVWRGTRKSSIFVNSFYQVAIGVLQIRKVGIPSKGCLATGFGAAMNGEVADVH